MRLCRYQHNGTVEVALYHEEYIVPVNRAADELMIRVPAPSNHVLDYLPPEGRNFAALQRLDEAYRKLSVADQRRLSRPSKEARIRVPIAEPRSEERRVGQGRESGEP